jgi:hypothetical protein
MTSGLSSVLDLSDQSLDSQLSLFTNDQWSALNEGFKSTLPLPMDPLDEVVEDTITIVSNVLELSGDFETAIEYVRGVEDDTKISSVKKLLEIIEVILKLMVECKHLLMVPLKNTTIYASFGHPSWNYCFPLIFVSSLAEQSTLNQSLKNKHCITIARMLGDSRLTFGCLLILTMVKLKLIFG